MKVVKLRKSTRKTQELCELINKICVHPLNLRPLRANYSAKPIVLKPIADGERQAMVPAIEISLVIADKRHLVSQADEEAFHLYADHRGKTDLGYVAGVVVPVKHRMIPVVHEINTQIWAGTEK